MQDPRRRGRHGVTKPSAVRQVSWQQKSYNGLPCRRHWSTIAKNDGLGMLQLQSVLVDMYQRTGLQPFSFENPEDLATIVKAWPEWRMLLITASTNTPPGDFRWLTRLHTPPVHRSSTPRLPCHILIRMNSICCLSLSTTTPPAFMLLT